jgi:hypothetical protein
VVVWEQQHEGQGDATLMQLGEFRPSQLWELYPHYLSLSNHQLTIQPVVKSSQTPLTSFYVHLLLPLLSKFV